MDTDLLPISCLWIKNVKTSAPSGSSPVAVQVTDRSRSRHEESLVVKELPLFATQECTVFPVFPSFSESIKEDRENFPTFRVSTLVSGVLKQ